MKKIKYLVGSIIILLLILVIVLVLSNNKLDISKSVVTIESTDGSNINIGTGFIYKIDNNKSYILTNYHVISDNLKITVYDNDQNTFNASVVKHDIYNDLSIIVIDSKSFKPLLLSNNFDIKKDDKIYTLSSFPSEGKIKNGKIVGEIDYLSELYDFNPIEANIETSYGSSGSPVIDTKGEVIGMIFLRDKDYSNRSYFIPVTYILKFINN